MLKDLRGNLELDVLINENKKLELAIIKFTNSSFLFSY